MSVIPPVQSFEQFEKETTAIIKPRVSKLGLVLWSNVEKDIEAHEFLVEDLITAGEVALIGGDSGAGKTFLTLDLAMSVARGVPFLDKFAVKQGGVLYQPGEGARGLRTLRIPAYKQAHDLSEDDPIPFGVLSSNVNLYRDDADTESLINDINLAADLMGCPIRLLVIDTVSKATPGADENSGKDVGPVLARCQRIRDATGVTVLLVAHTNATGAKIRGHTSWRADVDSVLICSRRTDGKTVGSERDANGREIRDLQIIKVKDGDDGKKFPFVLRGHTLGERPNGKPLTSCTVETPDMGMLKDTRDDVSEPAKRLSDKPYNYLKAIEKALEEHGEAPPAEVKLPSGIRVVNRRHVRDAYALLYQGQEDDPVKRDQNMRKARERLGEVLLARGYMGQHKEWMWLTGRHKRRASVTQSTENVTEGVTNSGWNVTADDESVTSSVSGVMKNEPGW